MELVPESESESVSEAGAQVRPLRSATRSKAPEPTTEAATRSPLHPASVLRWTVVLAQEVAMVPWTIRQTRRSLVELPTRLDRLTDALEDTMAGLNATLPRLNDVMSEVTEGVGSVEEAVHELNGELGKTVFALDRLLPELSGMISAMDLRMSHMDETVSEMGAMARGVLGAIPGVRRSVRRPAPG